jgi:hypothetical protein
VSKSYHAWQSRVRVGDTTVGRGVFALRRFRPGKIIGVIQGIVCHDPEYGSAYCMDLGENRSLEPIAPFRYLNHSCEPNAEIVSIANAPRQRTDQLFLEAVREIRPGDQITIDYAWSSDDAIPCQCGAAACRGWIVDESQRSLLPTVTT